jgi:anti-sigma B factor antagonist
MSFNITEHHYAVVISLQGNIVGGPAASQFQDTVHELTAHGRKNVVVDLEKAAFMNSSGLGMIISGMTTLRNAGGDLRLARASSRIKALLTLTRLTGVLKQYDTVEGALRSFETPSDVVYTPAA